MQAGCHATACAAVPLYNSAGWVTLQDALQPVLSVLLVQGSCLAYNMTAATAATGADEEHAVC